MATKKKGLLEESTAIKRMLKLANLELLSENFVATKLQEEEEEKDEMGDEGEGMEGLPPAPEAGPPAPEAEAGLEAEAPPPSPEVEEMVRNILGAVSDAIQEVSGVAIEVEGSEEAPELPPAPSPEGEEEVELEPEEESKPEGLQEAQGSFPDHQDIKFFKDLVADVKASVAEWDAFLNSPPSHDKNAATTPMTKDMTSDDLKEGQKAKMVETITRRVTEHLLKVEAQKKTVAKKK